MRRTLKTSKQDQLPNEEWKWFCGWRISSSHVLWGKPVNCYKTDPSSSPKTRLSQPPPPEISVGRFESGSIPISITAYLSFVLIKRFSSVHIGLSSLVAYPWLSNLRSILWSLFRKAPPTAFELLIKSGHFFHVPELRRMAFPGLKSLRIQPVRHSGQSSYLAMTCP